MKLWFKKSRRLFALAPILFLVVACSSGAVDDTAPPVDPDTIVIADIFIDTTSDSINVNESSAITATVFGESGNPVPGVRVGFALSPAYMASISPSPATTGADGVARATLTARNQQGNLIITASAGEAVSNEKSLAILSGITPDQINVTATPGTLLIRGTASIRAEVLDQFGLPVPDGTAVAFAVANTNFGSMSSDLVTTINGFASATFTAAAQPGTATIEVSVGAVNNSVDILINQTQPASLQFVSADPQRIALKGSGGDESSDIKFRVVDGSGNPVQGISVLVSIEKGPNGGEYIDSGDTTPKEIDVASDGDGIATATLRSGSTAGPVTLRATIVVDGVTFTTNSSVVSIGGGVPSASRFSVSASVLNIPGLDLNNLTTDITAYMSDRYGNYNILTGTAVSFWSEAALAVDAATATVNEDGLATVTARTQHPALNINTGGQDVAPLPWEVDLATYLQSTYGLISSTHPRDGQVSVLAYTQGEEHFDDLNANGLYDGEPFQDTHDDPFLDYNDNDLYNVYISPGDDPTEIFNDVDSSGTWDSFNGVWDSTKDIFNSFKLLITGPPIIGITPTTFNIADGGSQSFTFVVCDRNLNYLSAGTKISVSADGGGKVYADQVELDDKSFLPGAGMLPADAVSAHLSRIEYNATIADDDPGDADPPKTVALTISVEWEGRTEKLTITGSLN